MRIAVVCGTNREGALSRDLACEVAKCYQLLEHEVDSIDMSELPEEVLTPTAYAEKSPKVQALIERFLNCDGAVFVIPEYNGSYPGVLKLFIDMLPFPEGFDARPCAFIGIAAGQFKALRAVEHFQQVAAYRNAYIFPRRLVIGDSFNTMIDGKLADDELSERLQEQAAQFATFISKLTAV